MNKIMYVFDYIQFHLVPALWFGIIAIALYGGAGFLAESFRLTYNAIKDTITCDYDGYSWTLDGGNSRDWTCDFEKDDEYGNYYIDKENVPNLYIDVPEAPDYYIGDKEYSKEDAHPLIMYIDESTGTFYQEKDKVDVVDIKIIEWKPSEPLKGNIK